MSEQVVAQLPLEDWQRQARYAHQILRSHPLLQPLRDVGEPVLLSCHTRAIWVDTLPLGGGTYEITVRIEEPEWWAPMKKSRGHVLAERLAATLREEWERYQDNKTP